MNPRSLTLALSVALVTASAVADTADPRFGPNGEVTMVLTDPPIESLTNKQGQIIAGYYVAGVKVDDHSIGLKFSTNCDIAKYIITEMVLPVAGSYMPLPYPDRTLKAVSELSPDLAGHADFACKVARRQQAAKRLGLGSKLGL